VPEFIWSDERVRQHVLVVTRRIADDARTIQDLLKARADVDREGDWIPDATAGNSAAVAISAAATRQPVRMNILSFLNSMH
jgi:hypothetical protein